MTLRFPILIAILLFPLSLIAGGFEAGEQTSIANGRGGTGVVSKTDASAAYFNPSMLAESEGFNLTLDVNFLNQNLTFQRDPLVTKLGRTEFDEIKNEKSFFPIPFIAASYDFDTDFFAMGFSLFGPHSYGKSCLTEVVDGECITEKDNAARHMLIGNDLLIVFAMLDAAVAFEAPGGTFLIGAGGGIAYQDIKELDLIVDQVSPPRGEPYTENPNFQGRFAIRNATDLVPAYNFGISYISDSGFRIGFSGRPALNWNPRGEFKIQLPDGIKDLVTVSDSEIEIELTQAGSYRLGLGWFGGTHPYDNRKHLYDFEVNFVYEDWGKVDTFKATPNAELVFLETPLSLNPVFQNKSYRDTYSMRLGGSYAVSNFFTILGGGFIETAAQTSAFTNADFVSWERYSGSLGLTYDITDFLNFTVSYTHIFSPDRKVSNGKIFQQVPLSECVGPDYSAPQCTTPGTPPGTSQNEGEWTTSSQVISAGIQVHFQ